MAPGGLLTLAGAAAASTAAAAYLDAKLHLTKDLNQLARAERGAQNFARAVEQRKASGFFLFEAAAARLGDAPCIWSRGHPEYSWTQTYQRACQYGHYFRDLGVVAGQHVGVYLYNSPELMFIWMGLLSIGAAPALINYNLGSDALVHCVRLSRSRFLIYDDASDCSSRIHEVGERLRDINVEAIMLSGSGTTGLPKAAPITVARNYPSASLLPKTFGQKPGPNGDRTYYCIPLYHGTGGIAAMNDLMSGISIALAPKFSLSRFWDDCIESGSTIFVYVGELIRYLLSAPASPKDRQHRVRLVWGNGLSPELWTKFQDRFGVSDIGEFYASTEGVLTLLKHYRGGGFGLGAVGHHGWLLRRKFHNDYVPVRIDPETGDIWRSPKTGFAERLPYERGGEILARLPSRSAWAGYWHAEEATQKKLVENVFEKGDLYFRTGDALRRDADGHWYFLDRLGDTYRWKGENVSTTEVGQVLGSHADIAEANVYGVQVPNHDGRAGCAAIALKNAATPDTLDWSRLTSLLRSELPSYAVPVFIRVRETVGGMSTDNHKHNKVPLRDEGVDPRSMGSKVPGSEKDRFFWLPAGASKYVPFTERDWDLLSGQSAARPRL
uniref:Isopenicillin N epimerase component 1 n=1 Tax=Hapsidospora chrysogena TaxID=5044 RepID=CEFD1_HAPCH|nr:RecName: Full=Isopenicillin N epimerase component 1; Short=IPN epimerase component 1; AltName: Full=Isopenicillin N epimerase acyl-CoA synthase component [Hapsidospora chrysogena]CAD45625.1 isopenicillin N-CoA synthetase [Hapsidospora chrysogena]